MTSPWTTYLLRYSVGAGLYGFTRGFRSTYQYDKSAKQYTPHQYLTGDRITMGLVMTFMYANPGLAPLYILRLANRIEIGMRGWRAEDYPEEYRDGFGTYCPTIL